LQAASATVARRHRAGRAIDRGDQRARRGRRDGVSLAHAEMCVPSMTGCGGLVRLRASSDIRTILPDDAPITLDGGGEPHPQPRSTTSTSIA
jgi:hypothetical protein